MKEQTIPGKEVCSIPHVVKTPGNGLLDKWMKLTNKERREYNGYQGFKNGEKMGSNNQFNVDIIRRREIKNEKIRNMTPEQRKNRNKKANKANKIRREEKINGK